MTDRELREEVLLEIGCEPRVKAERIGVSVEGGVVTLAGPVGSTSEKLAAERAARRVYSAKAVVNDLEVLLPARDEVTDPELAREVVRVLESLAGIPPDSVRVTVRHGHVRLEGLVGSPQESEAAEEAVRHVRGVRDLKNHIAVRPAGSSAADVQARIADAFRRGAALAAGRVVVELAGGRVVLQGTVRCVHERDEAVEAARGAEGVTDVEDRLVIQP